MRRHAQPERRRPAAGAKSASELFGEERWRRRRAAALSVRTAIIVVPLAGSVATMAVLSRVLPSPSVDSGTLLRVAWWTVVLFGSLLAMWLVDRATRRLAPLAALLDMAVLFPGRAPTRFRVARRAGDVRQLESLSKQARDLDQRSGLADAAEQILALVGALRAHDRHTRGHSERVRVYTDLIAEQLRLPAASVDRLRWAALLHDIGKLRVPTATLNKPAKLSEREWETIREHPAEGAHLAAALLPWLAEWGRAIVEHHERYDGTGYPYGLIGREISLAGRIVAVADSFEVMTASRAYKRSMTRPAALEELVRASGRQFDADVVRAFLEVSVPRLRWAMGPTSWLVGTPLLGSAPSITAAGVAAQAAVGITTVAVAGAAGVAGFTAQAAATPQQSPEVSPAAAATTPAPASRARPVVAPQPGRAAVAHPAAPTVLATTGATSSTRPNQNPPGAPPPSATGPAVPPPPVRPPAPPSVSPPTKTAPPPPPAQTPPPPPPTKTAPPSKPSASPKTKKPKAPKNDSKGGPPSASPSASTKSHGKSGKG